MTLKVSWPVYIFENPSIAVILPQEILCEIFDYLGGHPVHFTRVARICRTWNFAADNHLFWKRLTKFLKLPDPKPRACKYKTHKSIVLKNWEISAPCVMWKKHEATDFVFDKFLLIRLRLIRSTLKLADGLKLYFVKVENSVHLQ